MRSFLLRGRIPGPEFESRSWDDAATALRLRSLLAPLRRRPSHRTAGRIRRGESGRRMRSDFLLKAPNVLTVHSLE